MTNSSPTKLYFNAIDGIRAIAVLVVIFYHIEIPFFGGGFVGVDVFFVISGFLITRNIMFDLSNMRFTFKQFYLTRIKRLIPALLVTIAISLLFAFLLFSPDGLIRVSGSAIAGVLSLANIRFWKNSGYFDVDSTSKPLLHLWSLSVEEQFYLLWPLLIVFGFRFFKGKLTQGFFILAVFLSSLFAAQYYVLDNSNTSFYWVQFRANEFAFGALLAWLNMYYPEVEKVSNRLSLNLISMSGLALLTYSVVYFDANTRFPGYNSLIPCGATLLLIWARNSDISNIFLSNTLFRSIGVISYSLYLVHWPIWVYWSFWNFGVPTYTQKILLFSFILVVGFILYFFVEKKFRYSTNKSQELGHKRFFIGLAICASLILISSWQVRVNKAWPLRINQFLINTGSDNITCEYINNSKRQQNCKFGNKDTPRSTGLLIGDSHSMNIREGLNEFGLKRDVHFQSISYAGCPPILGVELYYSDSMKPDQFCLSFERELQSTLKSIDVDVVVIVARWMWYFEHQPYFNDKSSEQAYLLDSSHRNLTDKSSRQVWVDGLKRTISLINKTGKNVILFSQPPLLNKGIGECNKSPNYLIKSQQHSERCKVLIKYEQIMQRLEFTNMTISGFSSKNVLTIKPSDFICDQVDEVCEIFTEEGLLYFDADHLSRLGSVRLVDSIEDRLIEFIQ